jgi:hypothetical protein
MKTRGVVTTLLVLTLASGVLAAPPNAPQSLTATVNGSTVTLTWIAPSTGSAPTGYVVVAALSPNGTPIAMLPVSNTTLVVPAVPNGVYYVHVRAVNIEGTSNASNEVIVVVPGGTPGCAAPPEAPRNLAGTVSSGLVTLAWTPAPTGCAATGYAVQAGSAPGLSNIAVINVGNVTTLSATAPPGTYYVRVIALNAAGGSQPSAEIALTVGAVSSPVTIGFDALATAANRSPISTHTESGFTLTTTAQDWMTLTSYGNPAPFIQFIRDATQSTQTGEVVVTANDAPFRFESVDVYSSTTPIPFEIVGVRGGASVLTLSGTVPNTFGGFAKITNTQPVVDIDTLVIRLTNPGTVGSNPVGFDNLVLRR